MNPTDFQLLEAAAKAAGLDYGVIHQRPHRRCPEGWTPWNPLGNDGDALRLAVKLGIGLGIDMQDEIVTAYAPNPSPQHFAEDAHEVNHYVAVRRAIVRAAAALAA